MNYNQARELAKAGRLSYDEQEALTEFDKALQDASRRKCWREDVPTIRCTTCHRRIRHADTFDGMLRHVTGPHHRAARKIG